MAYESWAGGTISSGADATSQSLKPRGGYISVGDIPNVPKMVDMPMINNYPKVPSIRYEQVQGQVDMQSRAAKLMQKELPSSFEEAGNIRTSAAGTGQMAWAKATQSAGEGISKELGTLSTVLSKIGAAGTKARDATAEATLNILHDDLQAEVQSIYKSKRPDEWPDAVKDASARYQKLAMGNVGSISDPNVRKIAEAKVNSTITSVGWGLEGQYGLQAIKDADDLGNQMISDGVKTGNFQKAIEGVALQEKAGSINSELAKEKYDQINTQQGREVMNTALLNPETAADLANEAESVLNGGKAKTFDILNKIPGLAPNAAHEAREKVKAFQQQGLQDLEKKFNAGELKTKEDFEREGKRLQLSSDNIELIYKTKMRPDQEPSAPKLVEARMAINNFDPDNDPKGENYVKTWALLEGLDPVHRQRYQQKLAAKMDEKGKPSTLQKNEHGFALKEIERRDAEGLMLDDLSYRDELLTARAKSKARDAAVNDLVKRGGDSKRVEALLKDPKYALTPDEKDALDKNAAAVQRATDKADLMLEGKPDFKSGELREAVFGKDSEAQKNMEKAAAATVTGAPKATPTPISAKLPTRDEALAKLTAPSELTGPVSARDLMLGGRAGGPTFAAAISAPGPSFRMTATAYTPLVDNALEGGNRVASRSGPAFMYEDYVAGKRPYVSAAMDDNSSLQGKFIINTARPNVVFKVEDRGDAFVGKGDTAIDIAYRDTSKGTNYEGISGTWKVVTPEEAKRIAAESQGQSLAGGRREGGYANSPHGVNPALMTRFTALQQQFPNYGLKVVSGFRDPGHNERVGGARGSEHTFGNAIDVNASHLSLGQRFALIEQAVKMGITGIGLYPSGNLHFDLGKKRMWGGDHTRATVPAQYLPLMRRLGYA